MKEINLIFVCLFFMISIIDGQDNYTLQWSNTQYIGSGGIAFSEPKILPDGSGGAYLCGSRHDVLFDIICIRYDDEGNIEWQYTYDGHYGQDIMRDAVFDSEGNLILLCKSEIGFNHNRVLLIKLSPLGEAFWEKEYYMNEANISGGNIVLDGEDNIYITGGTSIDVAGEWQSRGFCAKFDNEGELLWDKTFYAGAGHAINLNQDTVSVLGSASALSQYYLMKYNRFTGVLVDSILMPYYDSFVFPLFYPGTEGSFYIGKFSDGYRMDKVNNQGEIAWTYEKFPEIPDEPSGRLYYIMEGDSSNVYCAGQYFTECCGSKMLTTKLNQWGGKIWETVDYPFEKNYYTAPTDILVTNSNVYVSGTGENQDGLAERVIVKYSLSGEEKAALRYSSPEGNGDWGSTVGVDENESIFTLGDTYHEETITYSLTALKYVLEPDAVKSLPDISRVNIFPNPTKEIIYLHFESNISGRAVVNIRDPLGRLVKSILATLHTGINEIEFLSKDLPEGTLFVTVEAKGSVFTQKIVKVD